MKTLYHGSPSNFAQFDYSKIGQNATSEGYGFYFTNNKQVATNYAQNGYLYTINFSGKKSLSSEKKTITKTQLQKFIAELHKIHELGFLYDFGDIDTEGYESVLQQATNIVYNGNDNDVDMIAELCNVYGSKEPLKVLYNVLGYDHIQVLGEWNHNTGNENMIYIALVNDIIEIKKIEEVK